MSNWEKALQADPLVLRLAIKAVHDARRAIRQPNWQVAMSIFIVGSTRGFQICERAGIDPGAYDVGELYRVDEQDHRLFTDKLPF